MKKLILYLMLILAIPATAISQPGRSGHKGKPERQEQRQEPRHQPRQEPPRQEPRRQEPPRKDPPRQEPRHQEPPRQDLHQPAPTPAPTPAQPPRPGMSYRNYNEAVRIIASERFDDRRIDYFVDKTFFVGQSKKDLHRFNRC